MEWSSPSRSQRNIVQLLASYLADQFPYDDEDKITVQQNIHALDVLFVDFAFGPKVMASYKERLLSASFQLRWDSGDYGFITVDETDGLFSELDFTRFFLSQAKMYDRAPINKVSWVLQINEQQIMGLRDQFVQIKNVEIEYYPEQRFTPMGQAEVTETLKLAYPNQMLTPAWFERVLSETGAGLAAEVCSACAGIEMMVCTGCQTTVQCSAGCASHQCKQ